MNKFEFKNLTPFKWFVLENFPFIEADFDALTEWQLFCKLGKEMNKIINSENTLGTQMENVTNAFIDLQNYVNNYFDNLNVQEEVNNKLNEMAESGELAELVSQYLNAQAIIGFNTNNDLKNAENLANGSFARTYGKLTYNDGKGAFYKIRTRINSDNPDDDNIIVLINTENLVAEKMPDYNINSINSQLSSINNNLDILNNKKVVLVGDSYLQGYNGEGSNVNSWGDYFIQFAKLSSSQYYKVVESGAGFCREGGNYRNFLEGLEYANIPNKNTITDIIVCGGLNDYDYNYNQISEAIKNFSDYVNENFPNAKLYIGNIGNHSVLSAQGTSKRKEIVDTILRAYQNCNSYGALYLNDVEYICHNYSYFSADKVHLNQNGYEELGKAIFNSWLTGSYKYNTNQIQKSIHFGGDIQNATRPGGFGISGYMNNNIKTIFMFNINTGCTAFIPNSRQIKITADGAFDFALF